MTTLERFSIQDVEGIKRYYDENGIVIVADLLKASDLAEVKQDIGNLIRWYQVKAGIPQTYGEDTFHAGLQALEDVDHEYVGAIYDTIYQTPSFMRLISNPLLERHVKLLLGLGGEHPLYGFTNRCLFAPPGDERRTYGWHQEVFHTVPYSRYIQTWGPLVLDSVVANGTIEVCLGSHKEEIAKQVWTEPPGRNTQVLVDDAVSQKYRQVAVEMVVGEIALFSGFLIHRSGVNTSGLTRYSLVGMFHDVSHKGFMTPKIGFTYRHKTPRAYYDQVFA
jgi:ectoine hydroxylase-related dioxygenase (phytanoyl-CoA dioxygenase family)